MAGVARDPGRMLGKQTRAAGESRTVDTGRRSGADVFERWTQGVADGREPISATAPDTHPVADTPDIFKTWTQGIVDIGDPITVVARNIRDAREIIAKLAAKPSAAEVRVLSSELRRSLEAAKANAVHASSRPGGRDVAASVVNLIVEAEPYVAPNASAENNADPTSIAARGVEGPGDRLPFHDEIQRAFGAHDISGIRAHVGGAGADASRALGAEAYAHGNNIAFAAQPSLHLAAHEAAHVVQQRAGVAFKNSEPGDEFEEHANAVADTVVRGHSAEPLLSAMAGTGATATPARAIVQRQTAGARDQAEAFAPSKEFVRYVQIHAVDLGVAIQRQLAKTIWPDPTEDTVFTREGEYRFSQRISALMRDELDNADELVMMLYPGNALERFQQYVMRPGQVNNVAYKGFGEPLAQLVELAVKESLTKRIGPRYEQARARMMRSPTADDLIAGHPIDPLVAKAVCDEGILQANVATPKDLGPVKLGHVDAQWLGRKNVDLWNFVEVTPATATPEEVAAELWADPKMSKMAFAVEKFGNVFRVAPAYARQVLAARRDAVIGTADTDGSRAQQMVALAKSSAPSGQTAVAEFTGEQQTNAVSAAQLADIETHVGTLLDQIALQLAPVAMDKLVQPAFIARQSRAKTLAGADAPTRSHWLPVLSFQHTQLLSISAQLPAAVQAYQKVFAVLSFGDATRRRAHDDAEALVRDYAAAAGTSHLRDESTSIMRRIEQRQKAAEQNQLDATAVELHDATSSNTDSGGRTMRGNADAERDIEQQRQIAQNKRKASPYDRRKALVTAGEHALLARMDSARRSLEQLQEAADAAGFADGDALRAILQNAKIKSFPEVITNVRDHLAEVDRVWDRAIADPKNRPTVLEEGAPEDWDDWQAREAALPTARNEFAKIAGDQALGDFIREAVHKIQVQRIIHTLTTLAEALLLTVVAGAGAASIARAAASLVAEQGTYAFAAAEIAVNAPINSLVQMAISGDGNASFGWTMLENGLMDMFTRGLLHPMQNAEKAARDEVRAIAALPNLTDAERAAASTASFMGVRPVAELVGGMASQWAAHHIVDLAKAKMGSGGAHDEGVSDSFALTALQQGAAVSLGRFFHGRLDAWKAHRAQLEQTRFGALPEAKALFAARDKFFEDAARLEANPSPDPAESERLGQRNLELERQEHKLFEVETHRTADNLVTVHETSSESPVAAKPSAARKTAPSAEARSSDVAADRSTTHAAAQSDRGATHANGHSGSNQRDAANPAQDAMSADVQSAEAKWQQALAYIVESRVPPNELLPDTPENRDGLKRLAEIQHDKTIPAAIREAFMQEFAGELRGMKQPPENLFKVMKDIVYGREGAAKYQRKGTKIPDLAYVRDTLGGLRRCLSLRSLCARGTLSPEFYQQAQAANEKLGNAALPPYADLSWMNGAQAVVELIKSGAVDFQPDRDLLPTGMIKGMNAGDSGWFFAGNDADVSDVRSAQSQLAISGAYLDGYVVVDIPFEMALANEQTGHPGASRPTALDLTLDPLGKINPNASEPVGRTNPQSPGQVSAREVVLPPIPLSVTTKRTYVRGGAK